MQLNNFEGEQYRLCDNWFDFIPNIDQKINYLEIGAFYGANLLSVANTYGRNSESKLFCIDPWIDYDEYSEYKNKQVNIYNTFIRNINVSGFKDKIFVNRGFSRDKINDYEDDFFDMIYIDGNHEPNYVLEDAVLSFRKLKKAGYMIFDDYGWHGPFCTTRGIDAFLNAYFKQYKYLGEKSTQVFIQKL